MKSGATRCTPAPADVLVSDDMAPLPGPAATPARFLRARALCANPIVRVNVDNSVDSLRTRKGPSTISGEIVDGPCGLSEGRDDGDEDSIPSF